MRMICVHNEYDDGFLFYKLTLKKEYEVNLVSLIDSNKLDVGSLAEVVDDTGNKVFVETSLFITLDEYKRTKIKERYGKIK